MSMVILLFCKLGFVRIIGSIIVAMQFLLWMFRTVTTISYSEMIMSYMPLESLND